MSQALDSKKAKVDINRVDQQTHEVSTPSQFFGTKTIRDEKDGFGQSSGGLTSYLAYYCSSLSFILSLLHLKVIFSFFIHIVDSIPIRLPKRGRIVSLWVPFLFVIILLANLPIGAAGQEDTDEDGAEDTDEEEAEDTDEEEAEDTDEEEAEDTDEEEAPAQPPAPAQPEVDPLRIPADDQPHAVRDPDLRVEELVTGLKRPTAMAFLGGSSDDIIVTEKDNGTVRRVIDGVLQPEPLVDVAVANDNNTNERGLLGMAVVKQSETTTYVLIYYTESGGGQDGDDADGIVPAGNRLYRYELVEDPDSNSAQLINPKLLLDLPARPGPRYNAGPMLVSQNQNGTIIYLMIGDLDHHRSQSENYEDGPPPDGTGGIMAIDIEGNPLSNPVLLGQVNTQEENGDEENSGEDIGWLPYYFAYGLRNGFGMAFDPVTGYIWDTENGPDWFDEINLVRPGFNSGWAAIQGPSSRPENEGADVEDLEDFGGRGVYREPEFAWQNTVGVTAINFLNSTALGEEYANDMFVADINNGRLYHFDLNQDRTGLLLEAPLEDKVADTVPELDSVIFGTGFRSISDIEVGPDGYLYLLLFGPGKIMRIAPASAED
ncbi:MAG TPA: PQQ-dependent sugar dehydrogenase [Nitrososphaera sp.]|nr:PQQ-dependent sugar dehydrogenase [Nitrososphaera sp.]